MALATDLMGIGLPPQLALDLSDGGSTIAGSLGLTAAGNSFATGASVLADRRLVTVSNGNNTLAVSLPRVTGNASIGKMYTLANTGTDTVVVWASTGVIVSARGTNTSFALLGPGAVLIVFPITTSAWAGAGGQAT